MVRFCVSGGVLMLVCAGAFASGPADRVATDPKSVVSETNASGKPIPVAELLQTVRLGSPSWSLDGQQIAYVGNASGRLNVWVMSADGSGARQLLKSNDRQASPRFTQGWQRDRLRAG